MRAISKHNGCQQCTRQSEKMGPSFEEGCSTGPVDDRAQHQVQVLLRHSFCSAHLCSDKVQVISSTTMTGSTSESLGQVVLHCAEGHRTNPWRDRARQQDQLLLGVEYYSAHVISDKMRVSSKHNDDKQYFRKSEKMAPSLYRRMQNNQQRDRTRHHIIAISVFKFVLPICS